MKVPGAFAESFVCRTAGKAYMLQIEDPPEFQRHNVPEHAKSAIGKRHATEDIISRQLSFTGNALNVTRWVGHPPPRAAWVRTDPWAAHRVQRGKKAPVRSR